MDYCEQKLFKMFSFRILAVRSETTAVDEFNPESYVGTYFIKTINNHLKPT